MIAVLSLPSRYEGATSDLFSSRPIAMVRDTGRTYAIHSINGYAGKPLLLGDVEWHEFATEPEARAWVEADIRRRRSN